MLGELNRDNGKLPGRLDGDASCGYNAGQLLEVAGGEGWLSQDMEQVWVSGDARELGGGAFFMNQPCSLQGGSGLLLINKREDNEGATRGKPQLQPRSERKTLWAPDEEREGVLQGFESVLYRGRSMKEKKGKKGGQDETR